jgi:hypothetical protein
LIIQKKEKKIETFLKIANTEIPRYSRRFDRYLNLRKRITINFINLLKANFCRFPFANFYYDRKAVAKHFHTSNDALKMLVKLAPIVNFTNILRTAFTLVDPESVKETVK